MEILERIAQIGLVPVIRLERPEDAVPLAKALTAGELPVAEVTFRTDAAEESIRRIAAACPDLLLGAGTVLSCEQAERAVRAGAKFLVSPGLNPDVVACANELGVPIIPGVSTASELDRARTLGLRVVKFFPAEASGGLAMLKALAAPYPDMRFVPTGGIHAGNLEPYARWDHIAAVGGSWMVPADLIAQGRWAEITALCRQAVDILLGFAFGHIGINCPDEPQADTLGNWLTDSFHFDRQDNPGSAFLANRGFEVMKLPGEGEKGHIAILTNSIPRAMAHLALRGCSFDEQTAKVSGGKIGLIYLHGSYQGFRFHLSQR